MMFITGPMFSGKKTWVCESLGLSLQELTSRAVWDVQELAATADDLEMLCDDLTSSLPQKSAEESCL